MQASVDGGRFDGGQHRRHGTAALSECVRPQQDDQVRIGLSDNHRSSVLSRRADFVGLIGAMEGIKRNGQPSPTGLPFGLLAE